MIAEIALIAQLAGAGARGSCQASPSAPALDHAIVAVSDLEGAATAFRAAGFRIKPGRLHANGLLNRHIKFRDGTEIELMTVRGPGSDDMARRYRRQLDAGEGGVYVALKINDFTATERVAGESGLATRRSASGPWQFLSFTDDSPAAVVFFTFGEAPAQDPDSIFGHVPPVTGLAEVWIEGGPQLGVLLRRLGANGCGTVSAGDGRSAERWALRRGSIVVVPPRAGRPPRLLGVVLETGGISSMRIQPLQQFWVQYR
jgi:hypothetical protein